MVLNEIGKICDEELHVMLQKRPSVDLHEYVIMPNHVHLLLCIDETNNTNNININDNINDKCREEACPLPNNDIQRLPNNDIQHLPNNNIQHLSNTTNIPQKSIPNNDKTTIPAHITHQTVGSII
ncbi:MAG: hypothetical protein LBD11_01060 [Candidatus Peribacteria bacterium]|jgi:hypothetical protein|nr:hypothetical protein [Candidatus Peribacteria bacterium]